MRTESMPMAELAQLLAVQLENGIAPLMVTGSSMHPMLRHKRDTVYLTAVSSPLRRGDLILYRRDNGRYVLHRIVRLLPDGAFICSGDNQYQPERVENGQILAVEDGFLRGKKAYASSHWGYRIYVWVWTGLFPVRRPILAVRRCFASLRKRLKKGKK